LYCSGVAMGMAILPRDVWLPAEYPATRAQTSD
jgi:hypothetical protein